MLGGGVIAACVPLRANANVLQHGHIVSLRCLSTEPGQARLLDGRTGNGTVGLAPHTDPPFTGTWWKVLQAGNFFTLQCLGKIPGAGRWLDGRIADNTVGLAPTRQIPPFTGTRWEVHSMPGDGEVVALRCAAAPQDGGWLEGRIGEGAVRILPTVKRPFDSISWEARLPSVTIDPGTNQNPVNE
jgi:hypothetical protein